MLQLNSADCLQTSATPPISTLLLLSYSLSELRRDGGSQRLAPFTPSAQGQHSFGSARQRQKRTQLPQGG